MLGTTSIAIIFAAISSATLAAETKQGVLDHCAQIYHASGHPCACPGDHMRNGRACGHSSAHDRAGGASPVCSLDEVTPELLSNPAEVKERCHYHGR